MSIRETYDFAVGEITRALGEEITWRPGHPEEKTIRAVWGRGWDRIAAGDFRIDSRRPELMVRLDDLPSEPKQGYRLRIRGELFEIASVRVDTEEVSAMLVLKKL